jgi:tRNA-binding protein
LTEPTIEFADFERVDLRVGTILAVEDFARARNPSWRLTIDFGPELGERRSSVQAKNYAKDELVGTRVVAVVNFAPKNIAGFMSEVLVLGVPGADGEIALLTPSRDAPDGGRVY